MKLSLVLSAVVAAACVVAKPVKHYPPENRKHVKAQSSHAQPEKMPGNPDTYSELAAFAEQTYCKHSPVGMHLGTGKLLYRYGDGDKEQRIDFWHSKKSGIVVVWEGTNQESLMSIGHNVDFILVDANRTLFQQADKGTKVFEGYQKAYAKTASLVEHKVLEYQHKFNESRVTITGDSEGAGIAIMSIFHLDRVVKGGLHLVFMFGPPRVGNVEFANSVDRVFKDRYYYVANGDDIVVHVPPREFGYQHPSGQIWVEPPNSTHYKYYPGQENVHGANSIWYRSFSIPNHTGVYFGTELGGSELGQCPAQINGKGPSS